MKKCLKGTPPNSLKEYCFSNPHASWDNFKNECQEGYIEVQNKLQQDQGNLCCYCEINTKQGGGEAINDFRVEHFHPKSIANQSENNWALDWHNMLGCCHVGSEKYVIDNNARYIAEHSERHSDVLKGDSILDGDILNPLDIPAFPVLFKANRRDGHLSVHEQNCRKAGVDEVKAKNCLDPKKLNLNSVKLMRDRKVVLDAVNEQFAAQISKNISEEGALENLAKALLQKDDQQHWPAFFTTIRYYLGESSENYLKSINYDG